MSVHGTRSTGALNSSSSSSGIPSGSAPIPSGIPSGTPVGPPAPVGPIAPVVPLPIIRGGGSTIERLYCRSNLGRLAEECLIISCQHFQADWATVLPELSAVAVAVLVSPSTLLVGQLLLVPCSAWFGPGANIMARNAVVSSFIEAYPGSCVIPGVFPLPLLDKVGFYVFQVKSLGEFSQIAVGVEAVYIETLPPFNVDLTIPLCVGNGSLSSGIVVDFSIPISDESFILIAEKELTRQYSIDHPLLGTLGKRPAAEAIANFSSRSSAGFMTSTNDGRSVCRYSKESHDKELELTQGCIRLLWSSPDKLSELFGVCDHRWDRKKIQDAIESAYFNIVSKGHWLSIKSHFFRVRDLRVMKDPDLFQAALCFKASAADHSVLGAADFLPVSTIPDFSSDDHVHLFSAFGFFGMFLAVHVHEGYLDILQDSEKFICADNRLFTLPDYVLHMVFMMMLDSVGKDLNCMTDEAGSPSWQTDKMKGVNLIKDSAKLHFTREMCLKVSDEWEFHYKKKHVAWSVKAAAVPVSKDVTASATKDIIGSTSKKDLAQYRNAFCIRDVKFFYSFVQSKRPTQACSAVACSGKHIDPSSPPKKDAVLTWLRDVSVQGQKGVIAPWKLDMAKFIQDKK